MVRTRNFLVKHVAALPETMVYFDNLALLQRIFTEAEKRSLGYPHAHTRAWVQRLYSAAFLSRSYHTTIKSHADDRRTS